MDDVSPTIRIAAEELHGFVERIFVDAGFSTGHAAALADVLTWANLRGIESHGVLRIPTYLGFVANGEMKPQAVPKVVIDLPAAVLIEADRAAGPATMIMATDLAVTKAKTAGIGLAQVRHATHTGPIGFYALRAAEAGMAAIVLSSSTPNMAYAGAARAGVANCPLAIGMPAEGRPPLILDMATSVAAAGKLKHAEDIGSAIPEGWALTKDGKPATDPAKAAVLLPIGGAKGSGLALMIECLTGVMIGNPILEAILAGREQKGHRQNAQVIALNIAAFGDPGDAAQATSALATALKALPKAEGTDEILMPGERGALTEAERRKSGIPLARGTWKKLEDLAKDKGIPLPKIIR
jgi:ureidoglycolate dehydrogenase (NAD+)